MIKNERQYKITRAALEKLKDVLVKFDSDPDLPHDKMVRLTRDGVRYEVQNLQDDLDEYERLKREKTPIMEILSVDDLPQTLIKSRIALGLTHRELAERVGLQEQQIQRYEHTDYESASLSRIREIFHALDSERKNQDIPDSKYRLEWLFRKLGVDGLDRDFVIQKLAPKFAIDDNIPEEISAFQIASRVGRVFGWSSDRVLGREPLDTKPIPAGLSIPERYDTPRVRIHVAYARYIATLLSQATAHIKEVSVPGNPSAMREEILSSEFDFKGILEYVWAMGVPVISINLLSFDAACIRGNGKSVIVFDQRDRSTKRWILGLLRELHCVINNTEGIEFEASPDDSGSQRRADRSGASILPGHSDPDESVDDGILRRGHYEQVVEGSEMQTSTLESYVSRLFESIPPLRDIQIPSSKIRVMIRDAVLQNADFGLLARPDQDLLMQALRID